MANPGDLVKCMANVLGETDVFVRAFDRSLSEAGLRKKVGRGSSAAMMDSHDAANLLIAIASGGPAKSAAESFKKYSVLTSRVQRNSVRHGRSMVTVFDYREPATAAGMGLPAINNLSLDHSLVDMIDALIFSAQSGALEKAVGDRRPDSSINGLRSEGTWELSVRLTGPEPSAEVSIGCDDLLETIIYGTSEKFDPPGDLRREFTITHQTIVGLGQILRT
ncbi:hypothetical protein Q4555_11070 [Octadecabacter sp. 1_MG-2023]|uniref:hypothetical protein n=1 Tax=unclassified Octadecabacter TaxID=196158 RepID=UPI001C094E67|nr:MULTISPECIES: hypothetical protein [unclassified Octadecabacter]MBU2993942.1 hypothetical protein [Octadecabacter sp. B2R22]MDO6735212.1 hypothetical protein [Octadecabacter sp. 1_MG-2023]